MSYVRGLVGGLRKYWGELRGGLQSCWEELHLSGTYEDPAHVPYWKKYRTPDNTAGVSPSRTAYLQSDPRHRRTRSAPTITMLTEAY